ncbi:M24 family metallopeptidase [Mycoplasmatota bacterium zrk1]
MVLQRGKVIQAMDIVKEENIDLWITIGKETVMNSDPVIPLLSTTEFGSLTAILITNTSRNIALTGHLDFDGMKETKCFDEVRMYDKGFKDEFLKLLNEIKPEVIALNFSEDVASDGLSHGLYLRLTNYFEEFGFTGQIISSEKVIGKLRGRKTSEELKRIKKATKATEMILKECVGFIKEGVSELDIFNFCQSRIEELGYGYAWEKNHNPGVMVGHKGASGHVGPSSKVFVEKGDLVTLDFGIKVDEYSSDIQRVYYIPNDGETSVPKEFTKGLKNMHEAIDAGIAKMRPGLSAYVPDSEARRVLKEKGLPEFNFGFGHQVGREAHDGGVMMGPLWERYLGIVEAHLEVGMVFTVDINIPFSKGKIGQEDMAYIGEFETVLLSNRQNEIYFCKD